MASFWTRLVDTVTPWDRGGEVERRKKREEEQTGPRIQSQSRAPGQISIRPAQGPQNVFKPEEKPSSNPFNIGLTNKTSVPRKSEYDFQDRESELNKLTEKYTPGAIEDEKKQTSWWERSLTDRNWNKRAEVAARNKAVNEYNEKYGWKKDPASANFRRVTSERAKTAGEGGASKAVAPVLSIGRVGTGIAQGAAGTYDLLTPGKGQNRLTQSSTRKAEEIDRAADEMGVRDLYRKVNVPLEIASYFTPGVVSKTGKVANLTSKLTSKLDDVLRLAQNPTRTRKFISGVGEELFDPRNLAIDTKLNARYMGQDSARGEQITPRVVAENALMSLGGASLGPLSKRLARVFRRGGGAVDEVVGEAADEAARRLDVPVNQAPSEGAPINVRRPGQDAPLIQEVGGDARQATTSQEAQQVVDDIRRAETEDAFRASTSTRPDQRIEGVRPVPRFNTPLGEASGVTKLEIDTERAMLGDALNNREITKSEFDAANKALDETVPTDAELPRGQKIEVREEQGIPVRDETNVPQGLPEKPGTVRLTTSKAPARTEAELVANQPVVAPVKEQSDNVITRENFGNFEPDARSLAVSHGEAVSAGDFDTAKRIEDRVADIPAPGSTKLVGKLMDSRARAEAPTTAPGGDLAKTFEDVVAGLKESQKAYRVEKNMTKAEKSRRFANYDRIYNEARAAGKTSQEAEVMARSALGGSYTKNTVGNVDIDQASRDMLFDKVSKGPDSLNTKKAFEHLFNPERTEPLRNWERTRIRKFIQSELGEGAAQSLDEAIEAAEQAGERSVAGQVADFMTSAIAAGDISAVGRQGLSGLINHPRMSKGAWDDAAQAIFSPEGYAKFTADLADDADTAFIQENMGGKYLTLSDVADEARGPEATSKAISWYVDPSNRHYNTYLDSLRHRQKKAIIERYGGQEGFLKAAQNASPEDPAKWMKAWNNIIDRQSGRGSFSNFGSPTVGDMQVLFSARNLASKFQRLTAPFQLGLLKTNPDAYLYQLKETGTQAAVLLGTLAAISESGIAEVENGKIKIGNTRVDITGGFSTIINSMNNIRKALTEEPESGFARTPLDITKDFLQNQLSPTLGLIGKVMDIKKTDDGFEDKFGNPIDAKWALQAAPIPAVAQTVIDSALEGENPLETARNVALDAIGFNTNTYQSAEDKDEAARAETADIVNPQLESIKSSGLLNEQMIGSLSDDLQEMLASDKQLDEGELSEIKNALVKGISAEAGPDSDTAYRERGQYDLDKAALELKKEIMEADPTTKPSDLKTIDVQIKRSELLAKNEVPFELLDSYQSIGVEDWRKMGDPDSDMYDPEMFQELWAIDELMTKGKVSYGKDFDKQKYYQKTSKGRGGGRGGGRSSKLSTDFGKLTGAGSNAPKVREYATLAQSGGLVPRIKRTQPNIVHTIREGRV